MTVLYIISQVCAFIGMAIDLAGKIMKNKKYILLYMTAANLFYVSSYICLQSPLPAIIDTIGLIRGITYLYMERKNYSFKYYVLPIIFLNVAALTATLIFWNNALDLFLIAVVLLLTITFAFKNVLIARIGLLLNCALWLVYNFSIGGYMNMVCDILNLLMVLCAIVYYNIYLPKKQKGKSPDEKQMEIIRKTLEIK